MLSIIIVNWNGLRVLRPCLESIVKTIHEVDYEIVVVDNDSTDGSVQMMRENFPDVIIILNKKNLGFSKATNIGISNSTGEYILLLNNDTEIQANTITTAIKYLSEHDDIGALGCRVIYPDGKFQTSCFRFNSPWIIFLTRLLPLASVFNEKLNIGRYFGKDFQMPTDVDGVAGCFMMLPKWVVRLIGPLEEDFFMYGEDEVWCYKIHSIGLRVVIHPGCKITHIHRHSSSPVPRQLYESEFLSPVLVLEKTRGKTSAWIGNLILTVGSLFRMPYWIYSDLSSVNRIHDFIQILNMRMRILIRQFHRIVCPKIQQRNTYEFLGPK